MERLVWRYQNPIIRRRLGCTLIVLSALLAGGASRWAGLWLWLVAMVPLAFGLWLEARTSDGLLTMRFPGTRRRSLGLAGIGATALIAGLFVSSALPAGLPAALSIGGLGFILGGAGAVAWHQIATYAGDRIVHLSDEDW